MAAWRRTPASPTFVAQAVNQTLRLALNQGHADRFLPVLPGILAAVERRQDPRLD